MSTWFFGQINISLSPGGVSFEKLLGGGSKQTVRIFFTTPTPRLIAFASSFRGIEPLSLFEDEILELFDRAKQIYFGEKK